MSGPRKKAAARPPPIPFEQWRYRYIEGIGNDIIIEFVDPTMSGEYHMTMDPSEKDALTVRSRRRPHPDGADGAVRQDRSASTTPTARTWACRSAARRRA